MTRRALLFLTIATWAVTGCTESDEAELGQKTEGQACKQVSDCLAGLDCSDGACTPLAGGPSGPQRGDACTADSECAPDLVCGTQDACAPAHGAALGEACGLTVDCEPPNVCHGNDSICVDSTNPNPNDPLAPAGFGVLDLDDACDGFTDCRKPYLCAIGSANPTCQKLPFYLGPDCIRTEEEAGLFRSYFELPAEPVAADHEFYRLPYPNDIRRVDGNISLSGHPAPGEVLGIDVAGAYLTSVEEDVDAFAINGSVFFRFTDMPRNGSLCLDAGGIYPELPAPPPPCPPDDETCVEPEPPEAYCADGGEATVYLVNITPGSVGYGSRVPLQLAVFPERSQYMCQHGIGIGPLDGLPLSTGTTYAAIVTTGIRDIRNSAPIQDRDFARVLDADPELPSAVLAATEPLRAWIDDTGVDARTLANAAVFTTGNPATIAARLFSAVQAQPTPAFDSGAFECASAPPAGFELGCHAPAGSLRDCNPAPSPDFHEIHGTYQAPAYQEGDRPYTTSGGNLSLDAAGNPVNVFDETMCFVLTVPKGQAMPANGWPVILYSHGTGGNYRSFAIDPTGIVRTFSQLGFAVIGIDNVMHGPRQDLSQTPGGWDPATWELLDPGRLFFNVLNPRSARDNVLQGASDLFYLTRLVREAVPVSTGATGAVQLDPDRVYFFGHSQGTIIAPAYLAAEPAIEGAIFSGAGAELALSILNKKEPVDISQVTAAFFADQSLSRVHPMMNMVATLFGPSDAVSFARFMVSSAGRPSRPFMMIWGVGDNFTPNETQASLVRAMEIPLLRPVVLQVDPPLLEATGPLTGNFDGVPAAAVQLDPGAGEGHFVTFNHPDAEGILTRFLANGEVSR